MLPASSASTKAHLEQAIRAACLMEATAPKPGNVHPGAAFDDLCYQDFVASAHVIAPLLAAHASAGVGPAVLKAVAATQEVVGRNTNLGIVLLLAPLAAVPIEKPLAAGIGDVLDSLTRDDARAVYEAIRLAAPGGMGEVTEEDVSQHPRGTLLEVMRLAADRDLVAAQYAGKFDLVLNFGVPYLARIENFADRWDEAVVGLQLQFMARHPDTLIARKCGLEEAEQSAHRAREILDAGWPESRESQTRLADFDRWLRAEGNRRNPGTTADLVTACLFAAVREGRIVGPMTKGQGPRTK